MTLQQNYALATDGTFRLKVEMAMLKAGLDIVGEAASGDAVKDARRHDLGALVLNDDQGPWLERFAFAAAAFGTLTATSTDSDIQFVVNSIWDDIAGVGLGAGTVDLKKAFVPGSGV